MGPEPEYVVDGKTGFLFSHEGGPDALFSRLERIWNLSAGDVRRVSLNAFNKYEALNSPTLGERLAMIVREVVV
jgi:hypothetical protein